MLPRDVRCRAKYCCEKAGRFARGVGAAICIAPTEAETWAAGLWVNIDKAAVDFAARGAVAQGGNRLIKRRVGKHGTVNQHRVFRGIGGKLLRQYAFQKCVPPQPRHIFARKQSVKFTHRKGREGTREARGCARRKDEFCHIGKVRPPACRKVDGDPMLRLRYLGRAVQPQDLIMPVKIGDRHKQVERLVDRQKRRSGLARRHGLQRIQQ